MIDIDYIMNLIDWKKSESDQVKGIKLAKNVQSINAFLQPHDKKHNKNVWDNCAKILFERNDEELEPYLSELMRWLQDMNWPGAYCILKRLQKFEKDSWFDFILGSSIREAKLLNDEMWESNLQMIKNVNK